MVDPTKEVPHGRYSAERSLTRDKSLQAVVFGLIFGFLLQKGGVAKYDLLIGVLLFEDFTVIKMMGSAIAAGMVGMLILERGGKVELKLKPTKLGAVTLGGLLFGAGFGLSGYCPGTAAAALGQFNWDALFVIAGLISGSWFFAVSSARLDRTVGKWGDKGKLTLPDLLRVNRVPFVLLFLGALVAGLVVLGKLS